MNEKKMRRLIESARAEPAPEPAAEFTAGVMRAVRQVRVPGKASVLDQLGELFPRLATVALLVIGLCVAADFCASALGQPDLTGGVAELSEQWLFATKGF